MDRNDITNAVGFRQPKRVRICVLDLARFDDADASLLSEAELASAARFRFEADRRRFIAGRAALRRLVGPVELTTGTHGKPAAPGIEFNVSHSGERVLVAVGEVPVGVDVEQIDARRGVTEIAARYFSAIERAWIDAQPDPLRAFFQMWTRKESVMKADGRGVSLGLLEVRIDAPNALAHADGTTWQLTEIDAGADYAACVATPVGTVIERSAGVPAG